VDIEIREAERCHLANPADAFLHFDYRLKLVRAGMPERAGFLLGDYVEVHKGFECLGPIYPMIWYGILVKEHTDGVNKGNYTISPLMKDEDFTRPGEDPTDKRHSGTARMYREKGIYVTVIPYSSMPPCKLTLLRPVAPEDTHVSNWLVWKAIHKRRFWHAIERDWAIMVPDPRNPGSGSTNINYMRPEDRATARTYRDIYGPWCPWHPGHFGSPASSLYTGAGPRRPWINRFNPSQTLP